jgi:hypothetical protein
MQSFAGGRVLLLEDEELVASAAGVAVKQWFSIKVPMCALILRSRAA